LRVVQLRAELLQDSVGPDLHFVVNKIHRLFPFLGSLHFLFEEFDSFSQSFHVGVFLLLLLAFLLHLEGIFLTLLFFVFYL
jgi:hypothetical protein